MAPRGCRLAFTYPRRQLVWLLWLAPLLALLLGAVHSRTQTGFSDDFLPVYQGARSLRLSGDPYVSSAALPFVYPPSCALLLWPLGLLNAAAAANVGLALALSSLLVLCLTVGELARGRPFGRGTALLLMGLACSNLGYGTVQLGNLSLVVAALLAGSLLLLSRERPALAGVALGIAIALKPLVAPALLMFVPGRGRRIGAAVAVVLPMALNLLTFPLMRSPFKYVYNIMPALLRGDALPLGRNVALSGWGLREGVPAPMVMALRTTVVVLAVAVLIAVRRHPVVDATVVWGTLPVLTASMVSSVDEAHYSLVAVPLATALMRWERLGCSVLALCSTLLMAVSTSPTLVMVGQLGLLTAAGFASTGWWSRLDRRWSTAALQRSVVLASIAEPVSSGRANLAKTSVAIINNE